MRWGLIPDMTGTWVLPRLVGDDVAKELTFTGRMVSGTEAAAIGLCTRVAEDPRAEALALARRSPASPHGAIRHAKRLLDASVSPGRTAAEQFLDERTTMASLIGSPDNVEAVGAWFAKRDPVYPDPVATVWPKGSFLPVRPRDALDVDERRQAIGGGVDELDLTEESVRCRAGGSVRTGPVWLAR